MEIARGVEVEIKEKKDGHFMTINGIPVSNIKNKKLLNTIDWINNADMSELQASMIKRKPPKT